MWGGAPSGWSTFRETIAKGKLSFVKKIEGLHEDRWAKKFINENRTGSSWRREIKRWKKKENMEEEWDRLNSREIGRRIKANGWERWREGMEKKSTLKWYSRKQKPGRTAWHVGDWGSKLLLKARTGTLDLNGRNRDVQEQSCSLCVRVKETVEHMMVECVRYEEERRILIAEITETIGEEEWNKRLDEEDGGITTVLGLYSGNSKETDKVVKCTKKFLQKCCKETQTAGTTVKQVIQDRRSSDLQSDTKRKRSKEEEEEGDSDREDLRRKH